MKFIKNLSVVMVVLIFICGNSLQAKSLDSHFTILKPFLNKHWVGTLKSPDGSKEFRVNRRYESILNGKAIKCVKENADLNNYGEGYFYWNDLKKKISFLFIENNGVFLTGEVEVEKNTITIKGRITWPEKKPPPFQQSFEFKNTFEFIQDGKMIDRWSHNAFGQWRPGHMIEFRVLG